MSNRVQKAVELRDMKAYNCAQAVLCAKSDNDWIDLKTAYKIAEGFGSGMGGLGSTCGAVTAVCMLIGLKNSSGKLGDKSTRADTYKKIRIFTERFKEHAGSVLCRELKGENGHPVYPCQKCIETAAKLFENGEI